MRLLKAAEMNLLDKTAMEDYAIPGLLLMENAGRAVAQEACQILAGQEAAGRILIFAGRGNNAGDAFVAARHLHQKGFDVRLFLLYKPEELQGDTQVNWQILRKLGLRYQLVLGERDLHVVKIALLNACLVIDGIFGTGFHSPMAELAKNTIELINTSDKPVLAIDLPSGLLADTGMVPSVAIKAQKTVTFVSPKLGLVLENALPYVGELKVADICLPEETFDRLSSWRQLSDEDLVRRYLLPRPLDAHKGKFGHVLIVGGSKKMPGAPVLAARGALRAGAGLVTIAMPESICKCVMEQLPEAMLLPLPEGENGEISSFATEAIIEAAAGKIVAIGPGLGRFTETAVLIKEMVSRLPCPVILDADALYVLKEESNLIAKINQPVILTPHPGEAATLLQVDTEVVQKDRLRAAETLARDWQAITLLKGHRTIIAMPEGRIFVNPTGNPAMAAGGSGDVLTGCIAALLAQGLAPGLAAAIGAYLHGMAGDIAAQKLAGAGVLARDLADCLPEARKRIMDKKQK